MFREAELFDGRCDKPMQSSDDFAIAIAIAIAIASASASASASAVAVAVAVRFAVAVLLIPPLQVPSVDPDPEGAGHGCPAVSAEPWMASRKLARSDRAFELLPYRGDAFLWLLSLASSKKVTRPKAEAVAVAVAVAVAAALPLRLRLRLRLPLILLLPLIPHLQQPPCGLDPQGAGHGCPAVSAEPWMASRKLARSDRAFELLPCRGDAFLWLLSLASSKKVTRPKAEAFAVASQVLRDQKPKQDQGLSA
ncbi:MAG: hypothetical protein M3Q42_01540 [Pseudomonadota bacterium]|nr:hypothetical protein [Pseudomonadota bacterium]